MYANTSGASKSKLIIRAVDWVGLDSFSKIEFQFEGQFNGSSG